MKQFENSFGFEFWKASCLWRKKIEFSLGKIDLTHPQYVVLSSLVDSNQINICQKELSSVCSIDVATLSQIVRGLEKKMLLKRRHLKGDERAKYLKITPLGMQLLETASKAYYLANLEFFQPLDTSFEVFEKQIHKLL